MIQNTELLTRAAMAGNLDAFGELVAHHYPLVRGVVFRRVGDWDISEDLAQETLLAAHANLNKLRDSSAFPAWLCRIATNLSANWIRSEQYRRELAKRYKAERGTNDTTNFEASEDLARREQVHALLERLPAKLREALVIFYLEERTAPEAARILGIPENTFYNRVHRARKQMQDLVEQDLRETLRPDTRKVAQRRLLSVLPLLPVMPGLARRAAAVGPGFALGNVCLQIWTGAASVGGKSAFAALAFAVVATLSVVLWSRNDASRQPPLVHAADATAGDELAPSAPEDTDTSPPVGQVSAAAVSSPVPALSEIDPALGEEPQQVGTISGHVYGEDVVPLEGARVIVYAPGTEGDKQTMNEMEEFLDPMWGSIVHPENTFHTVSDAEGFFEITGIRSEGDARIAAYHEGYIADGNSTDVIAGEERTMNLTLERGEFVVGVLLSPSGTPVTDAKLYHVAIVREEGSTGIGTGVAAHMEGYSDKSGAFHMPVDLGGAERAVATIMVKSKSLGNALFHDIALHPKTPIKLQYPSPTYLRGSVTLSSDASAVGFQVRLEGYYSGPFGERMRLSNWNESTEVTPDGSYAFDQLDPKPIYRVTVLGLDGNEVALNREFLELQPTASNTVDLRVEESAWVFGRVYGLDSLRPIPNVRVRCAPVTTPPAVEFNASSATDFTAETDSEGNYRIEILRGWGAFQIMADYGRNKRLEQVPTRFVERLEVRPGKEYNVNLPAMAPWSRSFLVQDGDGNPVPDVGLQLYEVPLEGSGGSSYGVGRTDAEGRAILSRLDPGYGIWLDFRKEGYIPARASLLTGKPGETFPVETIVLQRISGDVAKLVDGNNVTFANRTVKVVLYSDGDLFTTIDTKTDERGMIRAEQRAELPGMFANGEISFELEIENPATDGKDGVIYRSNQIILPEDMTHSFGTITLEKVE